MIGETGGAMGMGMSEVLKKLTIMDGMLMIMEVIGVRAVVVILKNPKQVGKRMPKAMIREGRKTTMERGERVQVGTRKMRKRVVTVVGVVMTGTRSIVVVEEEEEEKEGGRSLSR